ncbi:MAG TPA: lipopolysaccharide assembly protein LapB, partial [Rhodocyclaceae bacterium]|nr:lipopolysaccharide assembly protein LapB [Rhodocyclaceae bacterium]
RNEEALKALLEIYQQEKEWAKAIDIARAMPTEHLWQKEIAEFHCEQAAGEMLHGRLDEAREQLRLALVANRKCVRATILEGDLAQSEGKPEAAIAAWTQVEQQNPIYLALVADKLMAAYRQGRSEEAGLQLLRGYLEQYSSLDMLDAAFDAELAAAGPESAYRMVRDELRRNPTLLGLDKLLQAQIVGVPPEKRADLELVKNLIHSHTRRVARYRCDNCGFKARQFHWRCPACGGWETYPPRRTEEFDLSP